MKAILEFNLPDDNIDYKIANKAADMRLVICEFTNAIRAKAKYQEKQPKSWEEVKDMWWAILNDYDIDPYNE